MLVFGGQCSRVSLWGGRMYQCVTVVVLVRDFVKCYVLWGKGISGFSEKSNGSRVVWWVRDHVLDDSINYNAILGTGGNSHAIGCNWGVNRAFLKFRGRGIENL
jgi:hypothetical protein